MTYGDPAWAFSRLWLAPLTKLFTRARMYGRERIPPGGCVLAVNHLHWVDICVVGATSPRTIQYVTKREAFELPIADIDHAKLVPNWDAVMHKHDKPNKRKHDRG